MNFDLVFPVFVYLVLTGACIISVFHFIWFVSPLSESSRSIHQGLLSAGNRAIKSTNTLAVVIMLE